MEKQKADEIIAAYTKKIFGFALLKTRTIADAEELAASAAAEVYESLRKAGQIENVGGYIRRICQNVYARWVDSGIKNRHLSFDDCVGPMAEDFTERYFDSETVRLLRREIAYLSQTQRKIVVLHYYDRLKLGEIARKLGLPLGTVKWHLFEAKNSLKEGLNTMRTKGQLGVKPISFCNMGHNGSPGSRGDTSDFLKTRLSQNIAYAAYWQPKTVNEIAEELGVSPLFVEDEVAELEEYGFLDKVPGSRYRTNIFITEPQKEESEWEHHFFTRCAEAVCEQYVPLLVECLKSFGKNEVYVPDGDFNLLLWAGVIYACGYKLNISTNDSETYCVKRKDGGEYIAFATAAVDFTTSFAPDKYTACGDMNRESDKYNLWSWQLNTIYDGRENGWRNNLTADYEFLYEFNKGMLKKEDSQIEKFQRLYEKAYLRQKDDRVNIVCVRDSSKGGNFTARLPGIPDSLKKLESDFDRELFDARKKLYPEHMQGLCQALSCGCFAMNDTRLRVAERLLQNGVLKLPDDKQKAGLNTILFSDTLPE